MDQPQANQPPRFQFSLRTALLLTPVLAGLVYLHTTHLKVAVVIDLCLLDSSAIYVGFSMCDNTARWKEIVGRVIGYSACLILLGLILQLFYFLFLPLR
jgi:hypothetical protein